MKYLCNTYHAYAIKNNFTCFYRTLNELVIAMCQLIYNFVAIPDHHIFFALITFIIFPLTILLCNIHTHAFTIKVMKSVRYILTIQLNHK